MDARPWFVKVTVRAPPVEPIARRPKSIAVGDRSVVCDAACTSTGMTIGDCEPSERRIVIAAANNSPPRRLLVSTVTANVAGVVPDAADILTRGSLDVAVQSIAPPLVS